MDRWINIDDSRNCYCGSHGEYENFNIHPDVLDEEIYVKKGHWVKVHGFVTPGGDPVWACSECGKGIHVYGVEHSSYGADIAEHQWVACPNCGAKMEREYNG